MRSQGFVLALCAIGLLGAGCSKNDGGGGGGIASQPGSPAGSGKQKTDPKTRNCDAGDPGPGIINGKKLASNSTLASHTVSVISITPVGVKGQYRRGNCTGSLIAPNLVLSAGHCFDDLTEESRVLIYFGTDEMCELAQNRQPKVGFATDLAVHPGYQSGKMTDKTIASDLAILKLRDNAPTGYKPIALMNNFPGLDASAPIYVPGFGKDTPANEEPFEDAMLRLAVLAADTSPSHPNKADSPILSMFNPNEGVCKGDSGGPSYVVTPNGLRQIGVNSVVKFRAPENACKEGSLAVNLWAQKTWIEKTARDMLSDQSLELFQ